MPTSPVAGAQPGLDPLDREPGAFLGGVVEGRDHDDVADPAGAVGLAQGVADHAAERTHRVVDVGLRRAADAVGFEGDDRDRVQTASGAGHPLLDQHGDEPLAQQAGDRVEGVGGELVGPTRAERAGAGRGVGEQPVQSVELLAQLLAALARTAAAPARRGAAVADRAGAPTRRPRWRTNIAVPE